MTHISSSVPAYWRLRSAAIVLATVCVVGCRDVQEPPDPTPANVSLVAGDAQSAVVGTAVATPPAVQVTNASGQPLPGVEVTFAVTAGGGSLSGATAVTNAGGIATVGSWTMGPLPGTNAITATVAGLQPTTFTATGMPPAPGTPVLLSPGFGQGQSALVGTAVAIDPTFAVYDIGFQPVSGVNVTFAVTAGGGSLGVASAVTNANGNVSGGSWTMGPLPGTNAITATVAGLQPATITALGLTLTPRTGVDSLALSGRPHGIAVSANGTFYVTQIDGNVVSRGQLSASTQAFAATTGVDRFPTSVAINPTRAEAYTTSLFGGLRIVDIGSDAAVGSVFIPGGGLNLVVSPPRDRVYATSVTGTLHVIDLATRTVIDTLSVGAVPNGLAIHEASDRLFVSSRDAATVTAIDMTTNGVLRTYAVAGMPQRIAVSSDGSTLYIASEDEGLEILDLASGSRTQVGTVGLPAIGLALAPDETEVWVTIAPKVGSPSSGYVQVFSLPSFVVTRLWSFGHPRNVAISPDGQVALIADEDDTVWFIR